MVLETPIYTKTRSVGQSWEVMASCLCVSGLKPWSGFVMAKTQTEGEMFEQGDKFHCVGHGYLKVIHPLIRPEDGEVFYRCYTNSGNEIVTVRGKTLEGNEAEFQW